MHKNTTAMKERMDNVSLVFHHHFIDRLAFLNSFISGVALYPQVWVVLRDGVATGVSFFTFVIILLNSVVWLLYAVHRGLLSLAIASTLNIMASAILVISIAVL